MRSAAEYVVQLREQLDAVKRRLDVFRHREFSQEIKSEYFFGFWNELRERPREPDGSRGSTDYAGVRVSARAV